MNIAISLVASGLIAFLFYRFFSGFEFTIAGGSASTRMERFAAADRRGVTDRLGDSIVDRLGLSLESWKRELLWAQLGGYYEGRTVGSILGRSILFMSFGLAYSLLVGISPAVLAILAVAAYYPYMQMHGKADTVREAVKRSLPEAAAMIAAEMAAGGSAETAILRAASLPGPLGNLLRAASTEAQQNGRLMFSQAMIEGELARSCTVYRMTELRAFAKQVDLVASKGAEGPRQMAEVARTLGRVYRSGVMQSSERLSNRLLLPMTLYVLMPFMLAVFLPLMLGIFTVF